MALGAMVVSWTLLSGQSSELQVIREVIVFPFASRSWMTQRLLCALCRCRTGRRGETSAGQRGPLPSWEMAGRTAPPAGPTLRAARGLR